MAKSSEAFTWKLYPHSKKECWECGRTLKRDDVGELRTKYPGAVTQFRCVTCQQKDVQQRIRKTRQELGIASHDDIPEDLYIGRERRDPDIDNEPFKGPR